MAVITGARFRTGVYAGNGGDTAALGPFLVAGAPTDGGGGTFANIAQKGGLVIDTTNANLYINSGTLASPTWKLFTRAAE